MRIEEDCEYKYPKKVATKRKIGIKYFDPDDPRYDTAPGAGLYLVV